MVTLKSLFLALGIWFEVGTGYHFWAGGDPQNPVDYAICVRRDLDNKRDHGIAHRTLPCRSKVLVINLENGRSSVGIVVDRGPYGKTKGRFRGVADLTTSMNKALKAKGTAKIVLVSFLP